MTISARDHLMERFQWVGGHADMWPLFRDGDAFRVIVRALVAPFRDAGVTGMCGIESRGFLLGGAAALELGVGFIAVRKAAGMFPGEKLVRETEPDYRGIRHSLRIQRASLGPADRVRLDHFWVRLSSLRRRRAELVAHRIVLHWHVAPRAAAAVLAGHPDATHDCGRRRCPIAQR